MGASAATNPAISASMRTGLIMCDSAWRRAGKTPCDNGNMIGALAPDFRISSDILL
jgi:hypothetical protein